MAEVDPRRAKLEAQRARIRKEAGMPNAYDQSADRHPVKEPYPEFGKLYDKFPSGIAANMPGPTKAAATPAPATTQIPANKGDNTPASKSAVKSAPKAAPKKAKGAAGAASNRDLPGKTTMKMAAPKKDLSKLRAQSKASLADSKRAAAARKNGPGGGASTVLSHLRGNKSHFSRREK